MTPANIAYIHNIYYLVVVEKRAIKTLFFFLLRIVIILLSLINCFKNSLEPNQRPKLHQPICGLPLRQVRFSSSPLDLAEAASACVTLLTGCVPLFDVVVNGVRTLI
jgi:hypothetical protein